MQKTYGYHEYEKVLMHYSKTGKGKKVLLTFHGFGQTSNHFNQLEEVLSKEYTIYSFDLFFHGKSYWPFKDQPLQKEFWIQLFESFLSSQHIDRFSLLGFSMGGKFVLACLEYFYSRIDKVILIAPDGIKTNFWYSLATYPTFLQGLFKRTIVRPSIYHSMVNTLNRLRLLDKSIHRFANTQMITREQRRRVYYSWIVFKDLKFDTRKLAKVINDNGIELELFLGIYDKIIRLKNIKPFLNNLRHYRVEVLTAGHTNLIQAVAKFYSRKEI
jgi:pimeloyl-ACP methyl ester carboxylesterase